MLYRFCDRVFQGSSKPYYEAYRGHVFRIIHYHPEDEMCGHVWLTCDDDPTIKVQGYVHFEDLVAVKE